MKFNIETTVVQARTRKLKAQWTFIDPRKPYPPFVDYGLCETSCVQKGIINWDGYIDDIPHYVGDGVVAELAELLQAELKNANI